MSSNVVDLKTGEEIPDDQLTFAEVMPVTPQAFVKVINGTVSAFNVNLESGIKVGDQVTFTVTAQVEGFTYRGGDKEDIKFALGAVNVERA